MTQQLAPAEAMLLELALHVSVDKHNCDLSGTEIVPALDALIRLQPFAHEDINRRVELSPPSRHRYCLFIRAEALAISCKMPRGARLVLV